MFGDLTTLAAVKAWLSTGQQPMPPTDDALLTALVSAESQAMQTWLGRQLAAQDWAEARDGNDGVRMSFAAFPVSAVLSLTIDGRPISPAPPLGGVNSGFGYVFTPTQLGLRGCRFWRGVQNIGLVYTAGYAAVPPDLMQAATELVALRYKERSRTGETSKHLGGESVNYRAGLPDHLTMTLARYQQVAPVEGFLVPAGTQTDPATLVAAA